ncbi:MAG: hypothetical protein ACXWPM_10290 [Bdellovibrionota bacterium]
MRRSLAALLLLAAIGGGDVRSEELPPAAALEHTDTGGGGIFDHSHSHWGILLSTLGAPNPIAGGAIYRMNPLVDLRAQVAYLPVPLSSLFASSANIEAGGQLHPFKNAFFIGAAVGWQNVFTSMNLNFSQTTTATALNLAHIYVSPVIGCLWQRPSGFLIGFDAGIQIPLVAWGGLAVTGADPAGLAGYGASLAAASVGPATHLAQLLLPQITLLRLGYVF